MHAAQSSFPGSARRRLGKRMALAVALFLVGSALALADPAAAIRNWCRTDPVVSIDGELADVFVSAPAEAPTLVTGPNRIVVRLPAGVRATLVASDLGFGKGTAVSFDEAKRLRVTDRGIEVEIEAYVPATDDAMPVRVEFAPRAVGILWPASAEGTANEWITLRTTF